MNSPTGACSLSTTKRVQKLMKRASSAVAPFKWARISRGLKTRLAIRSQCYRERKPRWRRLTILLMLPLRRLPLVPALGKRTGSIGLHFADDLGGQAFHLLGVVEEQAELDEFGSCIRDLAQTCDAG